MGIGVSRCDPTPRRPQDKTLLNQEGFQNVLDGTALLRDRRGQTIDTHWSAIKLFNHGEKQAPIKMIETLRINAQQIEGRLRGCAINASISLDLGVVTNSS